MQSSSSSNSATAMIELRVESVDGEWRFLGFRTLVSGGGASAFFPIPFAAFLLCRVQEEKGRCRAEPRSFDVCLELLPPLLATGAAVFPAEAERFSSWWESETESLRCVSSSSVKGGPISWKWIPL